MGRFESKAKPTDTNLVMDLDPSVPSSIPRSMPFNVDYLIVAGGGGGGSDDAGGGGAGGLLTGTTTLTGEFYSITVGAGGSPGTQAGTGASNGSQGGNSVAFGLTAIGGGYGATQGNNGGSGGSGGGGGHSNSGAPTLGGNGTSLQGGKGGGGRFYTYPWPGGGGGGASQNGVDGLNGTPGDGGDGINFSTWLSGLSLGDNGWFAGGGGGGYKPGGTISLGGEGGGGNGGNDESNAGSIIPTAGQANTGGGGGGSGQARGDSAYQGKAGGSGIVIARYPGLPAATGGTIYYQNGATYHVFTSSGTFTPQKWKNLSDLYSSSHTLRNGARLTPNVGGGSIEFDGTNDYALGSLPSINNAHTVTLWIYDVNGLPQITSSSTGRVTPLKGNGHWNPGLWLGYNKLRGHSSGKYTDYTDMNLRGPGWVMIGQVWDGSTLNLIINGRIVTANSTTNYSPGVPADLIVGAETTGGSSANFEGYISKVQIYDRALTSTEILLNYNDQRTNFGLMYTPTEGLGSESNPVENAQQLYDAGINQNGTYFIDTGAGVVPTYCEFKNGEGWMLVMNIKSDYFGDSILTWNDFDNWINAGVDVGDAANPFGGGQYRNSGIFNNIINEKWMIKIHNNGKEYGNGSWAAWNIQSPNTFRNIMNTPGTSGGGTQITDDYYAMEGLGDDGYANGLFWCPITRTLGHLRVNHLLNNNAVRILGNRNQLLETSNTDRTRGIGCNYAIAGTALTNTHPDWNAHVSPHCASNPYAAPFSSALRQFTEGQFPDGSNSNTATQGEVILADGIYPHYGIFVK